MARRRRFGALVLVAVASMLDAFACGSFGAASSDARDAAADVVDAAEDADTEVLVGIPCGEDRCASGSVCCLTETGPVCGDACDEGYSYSCLSNADCGQGVCCFRHLRSARCEPTCDEGGLFLCSDEADCVSDYGYHCKPVACHSQSSDWRGVPFSYCPPSHAIKFSATLINVSCTL